MKIYINPGHMPGVDSGAVNDKYGVTEAGIVKDIGAGVQQYLNRVGYDCMLVQSDNLCGESPNYTNICASANGWKADLFISIHCNARPQKKPRGRKPWCTAVTVKKPAVWQNASRTRSSGAWAPWTGA